MKNNDEKSFYERNKILIYSLVGILFIFFLWWLIAFIINNKSVFPSPIETFKEFFVLFVDPKLWINMGWTIARFLLSFIISAFLGLILGIIGGLYDGFKAFLNPLIVVIRTIPTIIVLLIVLAVFKTQYSPYILTFFVVFPIIYENTAQGLRKIDPSIIDSLRLDLGYRHPQSIIKVLLPLSSHYIVLGIVTSLGLGLKVEIMAEIVSGNTTMNGLGTMIYNEWYLNSNVVGMFAIAMYAILLIGITDILIYIIKKVINSSENAN